MLFRKPKLPFPNLPADDYYNSSNGTCAICHRTIYGGEAIALTPKYGTLCGKHMHTSHFWYNQIRWRLHRAVYVAKFYLMYWIPTDWQNFKQKFKGPNARS